MSTPVETVSSGENLVDVAARMAQSPYRRFPVVDQGRLVGLLSRRDVLRALDNGSWFIP
jgi:CBS domain-containing protein